MKISLIFCSIIIVSSMVSLIHAQPIAGYEALSSWEDWSRLKVGAQSGLASSYDRSGGNYDWDHYEYPEGLIEEEVLCTIKIIQGPGIIYRFWMPHYMARNHYVVRMYFDGETTARIDTESNTIFDGLFECFSEPLIITVAGGQICYEPIAFSESVIIETMNKPSGPFANRHYYQYTYMTYPAGTEIDSYTGSLTTEQQQQRSKVVSMLDNVGEHPDSNCAGVMEVSTSPAIIDSNLTLADLAGPGLIRKINIKMTDANDTELEGLNLRIYYDDQNNPSIDIPVAHFFGAGKERTAYRSLPIGTDSNDGFYCYWPMPFRNSVLVKLFNTTAEPIAIDSAKVEYEQKQLDHHTCYLHATKNTSVRQSGQIYHTILSTTGQGHYVGDLLYVQQNADSFYMLEGDDVIYADGQLVQNGTGLEDTYNGGAYYNWVAVIPDEPEGPYPQSATRPLSGILYVNRYTDFARADQYRWRIADCIPFAESIEANVECRYAQVGSRWISVGFWYQLPYLLEDISEDGRVDFIDFALFADDWLDTDSDSCDRSDFNGDGKVNEWDLQKFTSAWLDSHFNGL